jgi:hypothetical protein
MFERLSVVALALITATIAAAPRAQTGVPEMLWQFEAGG